MSWSLRIIPSAVPTPDVARELYSIVRTFFKTVFER